MLSSYMTQEPSHYICIRETIITKNALYYIEFTLKQK